jgi:hypothetical protein
LSGDLPEVPIQRQYNARFGFGEFQEDNVFPSSAEPVLAKGHRGHRREAPRRLASESSRQRGDASTLELDRPCIRGPSSWRTTNRRECPLE